MRRHYDRATGILSSYSFYIEGVRVDFDDSWCAGATVSLYTQCRGVRRLLYTRIDCPKVLNWMPPEPEYLRKGLEIEYLEDRYMRHEMLATERDADKVAPRAVYDEQDVAHIAVTNPFSVGTATVLLKVRLYYPHPKVDVRFCVEFASQEDCTRFLHEDMKLEGRYIRDRHTDVAVIDDITDALLSICGNYLSAAKNALRRGIPYSQFQDEYPEPETQLIRHRGHDRPCYLTLSISVWSSFIWSVDWSATTIPPTFPSPSGAFQSLENLHLKFPLHDHNSSHQDNLTITISAGEISFSTGTNSISLGNGFTLSSEHRTVNINYINAIMGDAFMGTINGGNNGGRNNTNTISMRTDEGARAWPTEPTPTRKSISMFIRSFAQAIRFRPPRAP